MNENHHLYRRANVWYVKFHVDGKPVRISTRSQDVESARGVRDQIIKKAERCSIDRVALRMAPSVYDGPVPPDDFVDGIAKSMWKRVKARARARRLGCMLTKADVFLLLKKSGWRCAVSGIPFDVGRDFTRSTGPFKPSLDRIDSGQPYTLENVRVVCCAANLAMNSWGLPTLVLLAEGVLRHKSGQDQKKAAAKAA